MNANSVDDSKLAPRNLFDDLKRRLEQGHRVTLNLYSWRQANITIAGFHTKSAFENLQDWAAFAGYHFTYNPGYDTAIIGPSNEPHQPLQLFGGG